MSAFNHLPDELWILILTEILNDKTAQNRCDKLVVLGNLSMTNRRLRNLVLPLLEHCLDLLIGNHHSTASDCLYNEVNLRVLVEAWYTIFQCPMLAHHIRTLRTDMTILGTSNAQRAATIQEHALRLQHERYNTTGNLEKGAELFKKVRPFGQKVLRALGVNESIREWDSAEGWLALLLLMLPKLKWIMWTGRGVVDTTSPLLRMVDIAKKQKPQISFKSLELVEIKHHSRVPDALKWNFLVLPSVEAILGTRHSTNNDLADRMQISRDLQRFSLTTFQSGLPLPMHLLEEKFRLMPGVRQFHYRYSLHHNGGYVQMMALARILRQLHRTLEELCIEPLAPTSAIYQNRARTSPHLWKRLPSEQPIGNLGDASWLLGSLTAFERLRVIRVPRTALYDPRYVVALRRLLPRSLQHLDVSPGPPPHKLDAAMLTTQLVALIRSKPEHFPRFIKLTLGSHTMLLTPLLRDVCVKFGVEIENSLQRTSLTTGDTREAGAELVMENKQSDVSVTTQIKHASYNLSLVER